MRKESKYNMKNPFSLNNSQKTHRKTCGRVTKEVIGELNRMLKGWAYESMDSHVRRRLRQWLERKHKVKGTISER